MAVKGSNGAGALDTRLLREEATSITDAVVRIVRGMSIVLAHFLPAFLDLFGFLLIHAGEFVAGLAHDMQHLV